MADYFISYTVADKGWAEWIGYVLEEDDSSVILQAWDFRPGSNFVLEMQKAATSATRTIMVLSPDYFKSEFTPSEWASAFSNDPRAAKHGLIPIVVCDCRAEGLLRSIVHINLVGLTENDARSQLLDGLSLKRAKPAKRPAFPGMTSERPHKSFPGLGSTPAAQSASPYLPKVRYAVTDIEKRRFLRQSFNTIGIYFEHALKEMAQQTDGMECDFQHVTSNEFTAEVFLHGKSVSACRIWIGGGFSENAISYSEGRLHFGNNSCNEMLSLGEEGGVPMLSSLMGAGFGFGRSVEHLDLKRLSAENAAEYLWRRFVGRLEE